ncbi:MAG: NAD(P)/FAD-dependent oxidoreductase [Bacilli bacterium]|nr:NAD(P)/FAD-dependent oxidoreductase [Bacilli bacterium]
MNKKLVIIGGGSAGMASALEAYKQGVTDILILEKNDYLGGILNQCIHNGFGLHEFNEELTGPEFMSRFSKAVNDNHISYRLQSNVLGISKDKVVTYSNSYEGLVEVKAEAIILTTGCYERNAGAIQIAGDRPSGVYTAGQAQLYLNCYGYLVGKKVFILGSGDIGLIMARRMTLEGAKVLGVAELNPYSAGLNRNIVQCLQDFNIPLYLSHTVKEVKGKEGHLEKVVIAKVDEKFAFIPGTEVEFDVDTLLLSVGLIPNCDLLNNLPLSFSKTRGPVVSQDMETEIEGLFSAGNVLHVHDLVDYVVEEAREAANGAVKYLNGKLSHKGHIYDVKPGNGIGYVVPQKIYLEDANDKLVFKFRVAHPFKDINIFIKEGDNVVKKLFKPAIIPSEMEIVRVDKALFKGEAKEISVYVEERK